MLDNDSIVSWSTRNVVSVTETAPSYPRFTSFNLDDKLNDQLFRDVEATVTANEVTASVSGIGEIGVTEGTNKIEVKVTAENGNVNTYIINVTVKELDPIEVTVDNKKYNIIRKEGILEVPENYEKSTIKIGEEDVLCYKNIITNNINKTKIFFT
mgnify:CR=1 FL=1